MQILDYWLCASCQRILAERVRIGDGLLQVACWGCGMVNLLPVPVTMSDIPEGVELENLAITIHAKDEAASVIHGMTAPLKKGKA